MAISEERLGRLDRTPASIAETSDQLNDTDRYNLVSLAWIAFLALVAVVIWMSIIPPFMADRTEASRSAEGRDDAAAIIARFGHPEADSAADSSASTVRTLTYRARRVRVAFVRHGSRHAPPTWKLSGFLDLERDAVVGGGEALRRLNSPWR
jgi:hypothetical protein